MTSLAYPSEVCRVCRKRRYSASQNRARAQYNRRGRRLSTWADLCRCAKVRARVRS